MQMAVEVKVQGQWAKLKREAAARRVMLESATEAYLFFYDGNETWRLSSRLPSLRLERTLLKIFFTLLIS